MLRQLFRTLGVVLALQIVTAASSPTLAAAPGPQQPSAEVEALLERAGQAGKPDDKLRLYDEALARARALSDKTGEAIALNNIGLLYDNIGQPQRALGYYSQALPVEKAHQDKRVEAATLSNIGAVYREIGEPRKALEFLSQALPVEKAVEDPRGEADTLTNMGAVYDSIGEPRKALESYRQALPLRRAAQDQAGEAVTLNDIGLVYIEHGEPRKALEFYRQALPLARTAQDKRSEALTLISIGLVYHQLGQPHEALESYRQALPLVTALGEKRGEAATLNNIGQVYSDIGQFQQALAYYSQALPLRRDTLDPAGEARTQISMGHAYHEIGQLREALDFYRQALPPFRAAEDKRGEAGTLQSIGAIYDTIGQPKTALGNYRQALPLYKAAQDRAGEAGTLNSMGHAYDELGQPQQALALYRQALPLARAAQDKGEESATLNNLGLVYRKLGQPRKALGFYSQALRVERAVQDRSSEVSTLGNAALAEEALGRVVSAQSDLHEALALLETTRQGLGGLSAAKTTFLASHLSYYHDYIHLLLQQRDRAAAFEWAEKSKARALLDLLAAGKVDLNKGATPEQQEKERELQRRESQLNQEWVAEATKAAPDEARLAAIKQQLAQAERAFQQFTDQLHTLRPDLARNRLAKTVTLADLAHFLPADTALLDYVTLEAPHLDQTVLFCVTLQNGKATITTYPIASVAKVLREKAEDFRKGCGDPTSDYESKAQELYHLLVAPAAKQLAGKKRLLVCPDGPLWSLPFQALIPGSAAGVPTFLAQRYEIDYAYSATAAQAALQARHDPHRPKPSGTLLAFAHPDLGSLLAPGGNAAAARPILVDIRDLTRGGDGGLDLPGTEAEARALQQEFPDAKIYTGKEAQKSTALKEAGQYRYLHFATHGLLNNTAPMMSAVVLAQPPPGSDEDQFLTARDLFDLNLSADLVVLSACNTARGEKQAGEGVVGLTWALFAAGAPSQVVSQWSVNDASTAELMKQFYAGLKKGQAKGAALREAELGLLKDGRYGHPYYWAPFILLGDWR